MRRELWINAGTPKKEQFAHTVHVRRADDVVLNPQILDEKFDGIIVIRFDPANFCGRSKDDVWPFFLKKFRNRRFVREIKLSALASHNVGECFRFKPSHDRAADHPAMSGDEDLVGFIHDLHWQVFLAFSAFMRRAISGSR